MMAGPQTETTVVMRFATAGGAIVFLTRHEVPRPAPGNDTHDCSWKCSGCLQGSGTDQYNLHSMGYARDEANRHAGQCRAMPPDA